MSLLRWFSSNFLCALSDLCGQFFLNRFLTAEIAEGRREEGADRNNGATKGTNAKLFPSAPLFSASLSDLGG